MYQKAPSCPDTPNQIWKLLAITSAAVHLGAKLEIHKVTQVCPCTSLPLSLFFMKKVYLSKIAPQAITPPEIVRWRAM